MEERVTCICRHCLVEKYTQTSPLRLDFAVSAVGDVSVKHDCDQIAGDTPSQRDLPQHEVAGCPSSDAGDTPSGRLIATYKAGRAPCDPSSKPSSFTALDPDSSVPKHCPDKPDDRRNSSDDAPNDTRSERRRRPPECCRLPRGSEEGRGSDGRRRQHSCTYSGRHAV
ncbi:hypothetical protein VFPFJ_10933 [Purpureocillium lilacinum]|uniref:Uncharacterized protein n=1 Tax=Purpureocillium lilacinum TaxID=33203 RepID=A0A179G992_PURLI|nr:hypothetical protein VFPFJ_10933 [Purpureocillium lilacinum]OAQ74387.1 hypothetical protein VFPFJ_10933 [Purpureocillium lilacinum]